MSRSGGSATPAVWIDGSLCSPSEAVVPVMDRAVLVGAAAFETVKVIDGRPFALVRHLGRLARGCRALGIHLGVEEGELRSAVDAVVTAAGLETARVRITVTAGVEGARGSVVVTAAPAPVHAPSATCAVVPWVRNERSALAGLKTTSYAENVVALARAQALGADEAIFANTAGELCEGTATNVFVGIGGRLVTPPLASGCLAGVTRELLLEVLEVVEEPMPISELIDAEEVFLSSSTRGVQAVSAVDGRPMPSCPGPLTAAASAAWAVLEAGSPDP